jgi:hypothetical protein
MDHFGIGQALQGVLRGYFAGARRSGRTTSLVESVRDGDRVVCANLQTAEQLRQLLRERDLAVEVVMIPATEPERLFQLGTSTGRTLFDHVWIEAHYLHALAVAEGVVDTLQRETSGFGTAHVETRERARVERRRYWRGPGRPT